jgi:hypothetical protein
MKPPGPQKPGHPLRVMGFSGWRRRESNPPLGASGESDPWLVHLQRGATPLREVALQVDPASRLEGCVYRGAALVRLAP